jgi:hypothetical protein
MNRFWTVLAGSSGIIALLSGCGEGDKPASVGPVASPLKEVRIDQATQGEPHYTDQPVVATLSLQPPLRKSTLAGRLLELRSGQVAATADVELSERSASQQSLTFRSSAPWGAGRYLIELTLDGRMIAQRDLDIVARSPRDPTGVSLPR